MAKIIFDKHHNVDTPTLLLQNRNFDTIGIFSNISNLTYSENLNSANDVSFTTYYKNGYGKINPLWNSICDLKVIYVPEFNERFEMYVSIDEEDSTKKNISAISLCEAELSNIKLYNIEINTELDIQNELYDENFPTVFFRNPDLYMDYDWSNIKYKNYSEKDKKELLRKSSLLHRILEKAPHYSIAYVAPSIANIQRSFHISDTDIYNELVGEISEEFHCIFIFNSMTREISVYDLYNTCKKCGYRGDFSSHCPECQSTEFGGQYGKDTTVFISTDNFAEGINLKTNSNSLKNCFFIEGGDDVMTAAVRSINPNGSSYIINITDEVKSDMPSILSSALDSYNDLYQKYNTSHLYTLPQNYVDKYNSVVNYVNERFSSEKNFSLIPKSGIIGYPATTEAMYEAIDLFEFVNSSMMPIALTSGYEIEESLEAIIDGFHHGFSNDSHTFTNEIAIDNYTSAIASTIERVIKNTAKIFYSSAYYDFDVDTQYYLPGTSSSNGIWNGTFILTSLTEKDENGNKLTKSSETISLTISGHVELFIEQKIYRAVAEMDEIQKYDISNLKLNETTFRTQLGFYSLQELQNLSDSFQGCLDIIMSLDIEDNALNEELEEKYYNFYFSRKKIIDSEILIRNNMVESIKSIYFYDSESNNFSGCLYEIRKETNDILDFENYIKNLKNGTDLWNTFCSYRREDKYSNSNYISEGMTNAEIIEHAQKLLDSAKKELYRASHPQYTIDSTVENLLMIEEFQPLIENFSVGNWIRIMVDDKIFRLRLLSYQINYDELQYIDVEFATVEYIWSGMSDIKSVIDSATSISESYSYVMQQVDASKQTSGYVKDWIDEGFKATQTKFSTSDKQDILIDRHGILARLYDDINDCYSPFQLKILNNGLYFTSDEWKNIEVGVGRISYIDPETKQSVNDYGIIAKTVVGKLILSEKLGIYNANGSLKFTEDGLIVTNGTNSFIVNPNDNAGLIKILKGTSKQFYINSDGDVCLSGSININNKKFFVDINGNISSSASLSIANGKLTFTSSEGLKVDGIITTKSGSKIGGWTVTDNALFNGSISGNGIGSAALSTTDFGRTINGVSRENLRFAIGDNFAVNNSGIIYCSNANISGSINAESGTIGNFNIGDKYIANSTSQLGTTNESVYLGTDGISCGTGFIVYNTGECKIQGEIIAKGGISIIGGTWERDKFGRPYFVSDNISIDINVSEYTRGVGGLSVDYAILNGLKIGSISINNYGLIFDHHEVMNFEGNICNIGNYGNNLHTPGMDDAIINASLENVDIKALSVDSITGNIIPSGNNKNVGTSSHPWDYVFTQSIRLKPSGYNTTARINCPYVDGAIHDALTVSDDGVTTSIGWNGIVGETQWGTALNLRGQTVTAPNVGGITIKSDERLKNSFDKLDAYEHAYMELKPVSFKYNNGASGRKHFGFGAGQVKSVLENNGFTTKDFAGFVQMNDIIDSEIENPMGLIYTEFIAWNTHMIQKIIRENITLKERIEKLEGAV